MDSELESIQVSCPFQYEVSIILLRYSIHVCMDVNLPGITYSLRLIPFLLMENGTIDPYNAILP